MTEYNDLDKFGFEADDNELAEFGFEADDAVVRAKETEDISSDPGLLADILEGSKQGATFSFGDEIGGGIQAGMDATQRLLNQAGLSDPSPTQVEQMMQDQGFSPSGPTTSSELYSEAKAENLADYEEASERSPYAAGTGELAGALLTPGGIAKAGAKGLSKLGIKGLGKKAATLGATGAGVEAYGSDQDLETGLTSTALGGLLGGGLGKLAKGKTVAQKAIKGKELLEEADELALRSLGAGNKDIESQLESIYKYSKPRRSGIKALDEGIVDPVAKPKDTYKKIIGMRKKLQDQYTESLGKFDDGSMTMDNLTAKQLTDELYNDIQKGLPDTITDMVTPEMRKNLDNAASKLQDDLETALSGKNPAKELQDLFVRYNDDYFSNKMSPTAKSRRMIRDKIKSFQRDLIERADPQTKAQLNELDSQYTNMLDLEDITLSSASKKQVVGMGDLIRGVTAKMTGIPGASEAVTGASIASKKLAGKDITDLLEGVSAKSKYARAKKLLGQVERGETGRLSEIPEEVAMSTGVMTEKILEQPTDIESRVQKNFAQDNNKYIDNVIDLSGQDQASINQSLHNTILAKEDPDKMRRLSRMLSNAKTPQQKNALRFKLLQDKDYRRAMKELNLDQVK